MPETVLVVGFNSRPLAKSLTQSGIAVYAVDFFGDWDLSPVTVDYLAANAVLAQNGERGEAVPGRFQEIMVDLAKQIVDRYPAIELCIMGSGFDDYFDLVDEINHVVPVIGNTQDTLRVLRNEATMSTAATEAGFRIPPSMPVSILDAANDVRTPCVLSPDYSSGGLTKILIQNPDELDAQIKALGPERNRFTVEDFIPGRPMSCTFIAGGVNKIIAINDQLIGEDGCYPQGPLYYCGNVTPSGASPAVIEQARQCCQRLIDSLPIRGMNGIDFVAGKDGLYFMELNPRVPGSLEPIELSLKQPILADIFLESSELESREYTSQRAAAKYVLYAPREVSPSAQHLLRTMAWVEDIPAGESSIHIGEPICTAFATGETPDQARGKGSQLTKEIYEALFSEPD